MIQLSSLFWNFTVIHPWHRPTSSICMGTSWALSICTLMPSSSKKWTKIVSLMISFPLYFQLSLSETPSIHRLDFSDQLSNCHCFFSPNFHLWFGGFLPYFSRESTILLSNHSHPSTNHIFNFHESLFFSWMFLLHRNQFLFQRYNFSSLKSEKNIDGGGLF